MNKLSYHAFSQHSFFHYSQSRCAFTENGEGKTSKQKQYQHNSTSILVSGVGRIQNVPLPKFPVLIPGTINMMRCYIYEYIMLHEKKKFIKVIKVTNQLNLM